MIEQFEFVGRLVQLPPSSERCGDNAVAVVYKFEVLEMIRGETEHEFVLAMVPCPDLKAEDFFVKNGVYKVEATNDLDEAGAYMVANSYVGENLVLLWVQQIMKVA